MALNLCLIVTVMSSLLVFIESHVPETCDLCLREGMKWCPETSGVHCTSGLDACSEGETILDIPDVTTLPYSNHHREDLEWPRQSGQNCKKMLKMRVDGTTQTKELSFNIRTDNSDDERCEFTVQIVPEKFCDDTGRNNEFANVTFTADDVEITKKMYHVRCVCDCSLKKVIDDTERCNGNGDFACGVCICKDNWKGPNCAICEGEPNSPKCSGQGLYECGTCKCNAGCRGDRCENCFELNSPKCSGKGDLGREFGADKCHCRYPWTGEQCESCEKTRGDDAECTHPSKPNVKCSGNGICTKCDLCECYRDRPGSRYFDAHDRCSDLCMATNELDNCLLHPGKPLETCENIVYEKLNDTKLAEVDNLNRTIWVECYRNFSSCNVKYAAMKDDSGTRLMMIKTCGSEASSIVASNEPTKLSALPIVLGVLGGIIAAAAATFGYMHFMRKPPTPTWHGDISKLDGCGHANANPLFKNPITKYTNPLYNPLQNNATN